MHISDQYGQVDRGVQDLALPDLSSPSDSWTEGARQKELNERGAYIHRFKDQSSLNSMIAAVKKISEDNICTPCTLVGPSLCRSYNHYVWEGCAALLFSPAMNIVLSYKGDIYSDRLKNEPNLSHSNFKSGQAGRKESLELFSDAVRSKFNGYAATSSAFKGRRTKKLNLVVSASHHVAKTQEMEKRANLYFIPPENFPAINVDVSSKYLILDLCERYSDYQLPCKPVLQTKAQVLEFIDTVTQINPSLLPFLRAARIKISTFKDDSVVRLYFDNAKHTSTKQSHESSYADFMKWQFKNSQTGSNLLTHSDKSTTLTPNEVLGMPSTEDLVGLLIDPSTSKSFDQALATLKHLRESRTSNWASVAQSVPPFTHLVSHLDHGTLIQLGWSKMIIPYSTEGLTEYCTTGKITAIDGYKFGPDYFLLLHRIASNSILVFAKEHRTVDLLFVKPNVISNFSSVLSGGSKSLLFEAVEQGDIHTETLRLFCHLDRLGTGNFSRVREAHENSHANSRHKSTLEKLIILDDQKADEDLKNLLTAQINRIERSAFRKSGDHRTVKYRAGFEDQGIFEFNPSLGSLSLTEGVRKFDNGTRLIGVFKPDSDMKRGGASPTFGVILHANECKFGNLEGPLPPFSLCEMTSARGEEYFRLLLGHQEPVCLIDFSFDRRALAYFSLHTKIRDHAFKTRLRNSDWTGNLDQVLREPVKALRFVIDAIKATNNVPDEWLGSTIVCFSAARHAVSLQLNAAAAGLARSTGTYKAMHSESTRELAKSFQELINEIDKKVRTLARLYKNTDSNCDKLDSKLYELIDTAALPIRTYLSVSHQLNVNRPKPVPCATPAFAYVSPPVAPVPAVPAVPAVPVPVPTTQQTRQTAAAPVTRKISLARKLISRVKRALNM